MTRRFVIWYLRRKSKPTCTKHKYCSGCPYRLKTSKCTYGRCAVDRVIRELKEGESNACTN